jgi:thiamine kinase-like enzyme
MKIQELKKYSLFKNQKLEKLEKLKNQGICNTIYKLRTSKKEYLVRVFKHTHQDKESRKNEFIIQKKAYKKDIAAKPYILDEKNSLMICSFLKGKHKEKLENNDLNALVDTVKKLHTIKTTQKAHDLESDFKSYRKILKDEESKILIRDSLKELKKLKKYKFKAVFTHHDLNPKNILFYKKSVKFIDWEFACVNDKFFDLANICFEFKLNKKQEQQVLNSYFKKIKIKHVKKLASYKIIYENLWILWFKNQGKY